VLEGPTFSQFLPKVLVFTTSALKVYFPLLFRVYAHHAFINTEICIPPSVLWKLYLLYWTSICTHEGSLSQVSFPTGAWYCWLLVIFHLDIVTF